MFISTRAFKSLSFIGLALFLLGPLGCNRATEQGGSAQAPSGKGASQKAKVTVRLAFFPNVTHGVALVGLQRGTFAKALGEKAELKEQVFNAGPAEIEALFADQIDIGYIGPGPAINGFLKSQGEALRIVAGASSGGAGLVTRKEAGITDVKGMANKRIASPQIGGTQDISLRHALLKAGLQTTDKGGPVAVMPIANPDTLTLFQKKELDAAWVPEPWVARLVKEGDGVLLIDERKEWSEQKFASTLVIVRTAFLKAHPDLVSRFLEAHVETVQWIAAHQDEAQKIIGERIGQLTKKPLPPDILAASLSRTDFTYDPLRESVLTFADWARELKFQRKGRESLTELFDLTPLNAALTQRKLPPMAQ